MAPIIVSTNYLRGMSRGGGGGWGGGGGGGGGGGVGWGVGGGLGGGRSPHPAAPRIPRAVVFFCVFFLFFFFLFFCRGARKRGGESHGPSVTRWILLCYVLLQFLFECFHSSHLISSGAYFSETVGEFRWLWRSGLMAPTAEDGRGPPPRSGKSAPTTYADRLREVSCCQLRRGGRFHRSARRLLGLLVAQQPLTASPCSLGAWETTEASPSVGLA